MKKKRDGYMWNQSSKTIELVELKYKGDGEVENGRVELTWDELISEFSAHDVREKKDGPCFMPVQMKDREDWILSEPRPNHEPSYRNDANIDFITMVVIDLDKMDSLPKAEDMFSDFEYFIYSTHSYTADTPYKFRMVISLDSPIPSDEWPLAFKKITMGIDADKTCGNLSRVFFYPSISNEAGIAPFFKHNNGRDLTPADIDQFEKDYQKSLSPEERLQIKNKQLFALVKNNKRHFSGEHTDDSLKGGKDISYAYDAMKARHQVNISDLSSSDSRHNFALKTIAREIGIHREKTNIYYLTLFIHRASHEFSSKSLTSGNTLQEIPEMVCSAILKFAPEFDMDKQQIYAMIENASRSARVGMETDNWDFQPDGMVKNSNNFDKSVMLDVKRSGYSYSETRGRCLPFIRELINTGNIEDFAKNVFVSEISRSGSDADINAIGQFVMFCYKGYLEKHLNVESPSSTIEDVFPGVLDMVCNDKYIASQETNISQFIKTSLLIAKKSATGHLEWRFPKSLADSTELSM